MSEESIFREVDEELRSERMKNIWRRYGRYIIGAAVAVVAMVGANEGWQYWTTSNAARSSDQLYTALQLAENGDVAGAQEALNVSIAEGTGDYPILARLKQAALLAEDGKPDEAVAAYDAIAASGDEPRLRELALILAAYVLVDKSDIAGIQARVGGLIGSGNEFGNIAREALGLAQYRAGELEAARVTFQAILDDPSGPNDQLGRIDVYLSQLTAEGVTTPVVESKSE